MSVNKSTIRQFTRFMKSHNFSQHYVAEVLCLSQPSLSKLLNGVTIHIADATLTAIITRMQTWMDEYGQQEHLLYKRIAPEVQGMRISIVRNVFLSLLKDM